MISDKNRFIYIHIPKCGGTYITSHLLPHSEDYVHVRGRGDKSDRIMVRRPSEDWHNSFGVRYMHASANELKKYMGNKKYSKYFKFASIRNPWERLISIYFWGFPHMPINKINKKHFLSDWAPHSNQFECHIPRLKKTFRRSVCPAEYFLLDDNGEMIVDHVFFSKDIRENLKTIEEKLNLEKLQLSKRNYNKSNHLHYSHYYDNELKEMVEYYYDWEIKKFNFSFKEEGHD